MRTQIFFLMNHKYKHPFRTPSDMMPFWFDEKTKEEAKLPTEEKWNELQQTYGN